MPKYPKPYDGAHSCPDCGQHHNTPSNTKLLREHFSLCFACDEKVFYEYMVKDAVWKEARLKFEEGVLHLPCLESILGRELVLDDFMEAVTGANGNSINDAIRWAEERFNKLSHIGALKA